MPLIIDIALLESVEMTVSELLMCFIKNCKAIMIPYRLVTTTILWDLLNFQL